MRTFYFLLAFVIYCFEINSQSLLTLAEYRSNNNPTSGQSGVGVSGNVVATGLLRGPGLTFGGAGNFGARSWATTFTYNTTDYVQFTIGARPGFKINLKYIEFNFIRDNFGPSSIQVRTSLDNFNSTIYVDNAISTSNNTTGMSLNINNITSPITFRVYGYRASTSNGLLSLGAIPSYVEKLLTGTAQAGIVIKGTKSSAINNPNTGNLRQQSNDFSWETEEEYEDINNEVMSVYPNPTSTEAKIKFQGDNKEKTLRILDIDGSVLRQKTMINEEEVIDLSDLNVGVYFIEIINENTKSFKKKLVVNK